MNDLVVYILIAAAVYFLLPYVVAMLDTSHREGFTVVKPTERFLKSSWHSFRRAARKLRTELDELVDRMWRDMRKL